MPLPAPLVPDYGGACIAGIVPAVFDRHGGAPPSWLPAPVAGADQVVLLVLDGLGWDQLQARRHLAPNLAAMVGGPVTSVAPTTTATALTSITTGTAPAEHGIVGYRLSLGPSRVLNVLGWRTADGDARAEVQPEVLLRAVPFAGRIPPVVTRSEFATTGFTDAHLAGSALHGWRMPSTIVAEVAQLLAVGAPFVYAYYDGIDKVAHEHGLGAHYEAELAAADQLVGAVAATLPPGAVLLVTADHGQVDVGDATIALSPDVLADVDWLSGEGRFRWLHARPGTAARLRERAEAAHGDVAWVRTCDEVVEEGWYGGPLHPEVRRLLGDVAVVAAAPVSFADPGDRGEVRLRSRHGSLTPAEVLVPLLATAR